MKNFKTLLFPILIFLVSFMGIAQGGGGGWSANNSYSRLFDTANMVEFKGKITSIDKIIPAKGMSNGIHLMLKTDKNVNYSVHLGPQWYFDNHSIKYNVGDFIAVKGSKITYNNAPAIIAVSVQKGKTTLTLRDKNGFPVWSGSGQGQKGGGNCVNNM